MIPDGPLAYNYRRAIGALWASFERAKKFGVGDDAVRARSPEMRRFVRAEAFRLRREYEAAVAAGES